MKRDDWAPGWAFRDTVAARRSEAMDTLGRPVRQYERTARYRPILQGTQEHGQYERTGRRRGKTSRL